MEPSKEEGEEWKFIPNFPKYMISSHGRVWSKHVKRLLSLRNNGGYYQIGISGTERRAFKYVHRLVAEVFILNPDNKQCVNHIDEVKTNNKTDNLEWVSHSENVRHSYGKYKTAHPIPVIKMTMEGNEIARYESFKDAAASIGVTQRCISLCCKSKMTQSGGFKWKYADEDRHTHPKEYKDVEDYPNYCVTKDGKVFSRKINRFLKPNRNPEGYLVVQLSKDAISKHMFVHVLVATLYIKNPDSKPVVNHKNSKRDDNRAENLEWVSHSENSIHAVKYGNRKTRRVRQLNKDGIEIAVFDSIKEAAEVVGIKNRADITGVCRKRGNRRFCGGFCWEYA